MSAAGVIWLGDLGGLSVERSFEKVDPETQHHVFIGIGAVCATRLDLLKAQSADLQGAVKFARGDPIDDLAKLSDDAVERDDLAIERVEFSVIAARRHTCTVQNTSPRETLFSRMNLTAKLGNTVPPVGCAVETFATSAPCRRVMSIRVGQAPAGPCVTRVGRLAPRWAA